MATDQKSTLVTEIAIEPETVDDKSLADNFAYYCYFCDKKVKTECCHKNF